MHPLTHPFEDLAQALRILLEANHRAEVEGLIRLDRAEATGNVENAISGVLHAFHSLFDAMNKAGLKDAVDWYQTPELALMLVLRNARHHNHARKIRTLYTHYAHEARKIGDMERYVLVNFPAEEAGAGTFFVYLSWGDLDALLSMPNQMSSVKPNTAASIRRYLASDQFEKYASQFEVPSDRVVFNVVPLIANAALKVVPHLANEIEARSTEADAFLKLFNGIILPAYTDRHEVACGPIAYM